MLNPSHQNHLHLWLPDLSNSKGGIQTYSAFLLEAIQNFYPNTNYDIFLKHDKRSSNKFLDKNNTHFHFAGYYPLFLRTPAFAAQLISSGLWQRPNLVITTHINFTIAAYWLKHLADIPYWTVAHGVEAWNIQRPALQTALRNADRILAVSSYTRDRLLKEQNLNPNKISLLPNTFDANRFQIASKPTYLLERHGLRAEQPIVLTLARLAAAEQYKGYDKMLEALPQIRQTIPNIHYIIIGKGDDRARIEQLIHQRQLQNCVTLAGFIADSEICDYYNLCDVFAMPSKGEGFGIVYLEALACGKPTLAGDRDGSVDALCHGKLGALVDPDDHCKIAQTIIQILQGTYANPLIYQPELLRQKVIEQYGFEQFQNTLASHLEDRFLPTQSLEVPV